MTPNTKVCSLRGLSVDRFVSSKSLLRGRVVAPFDLALVEIEQEICCNFSQLPSFVEARSDLLLDLLPVRGAGPTDGSDFLLECHHVIDLFLDLAAGGDHFGMVAIFNGALSASLHDFEIVLHGVCACSFRCDSRGLFLACSRRR